MGFSLSLQNYAKPMGGHLGKLAMKFLHSGAYAVNSKINLYSGFSSMARGSKQLTLESIQRPHPALMDDNLTLSIHPFTKRYGPVTAATLSGGIVTVTVGSGHNLMTGERVSIRQVQGATELNASNQLVTRVSDTVFTVPLSGSLTTFSTSANSIVEVDRPFPELTVSGITTAGVFTTSAAHGLNVGDVVYITTIAGLTGPSLAIPYTAQIIATVPSSTTFTLSSGPTWSGGAFSGTTYCFIRRSIRQFGIARLMSAKALAIASFTVASPSVVTTGQSHGFKVGDTVYIDGCLDATAGPMLNGRRVIRTVPSATTFTCETTAGAPTNVTSGTPTANVGYISGFIEVPDTQVIECEGVMSLDLYPAIGDKGSFNGPLYL